MSHDTGRGHERAIAIIDVKRIPPLRTGSANVYLKRVLETRPAYNHDHHDVSSNDEEPCAFFASVRDHSLSLVALCTMLMRYASRLQVGY